MYGDRGQMREVFFRAWRKHRRGEPLAGVETIVVAVAQHHPEYHRLLEHPETYRDEDFAPATGASNPFLHLSLHIAIEEQLSIDRPPGVRALYQRLLLRLADEHTARHVMLDCLGEALWAAQRQGGAPDDAAYLACIKKNAGES